MYGKEWVAVAFIVESNVSHQFQNLNDIVVSRDGFILVFCIELGLESVSALALNNCKHSSLILPISRFLLDVHLHVLSQQELVDLVVTSVWFGQDCEGCIF